MARDSICFVGSFPAKNTRSSTRARLAANNGVSSKPATSGKSNDSENEVEFIEEVKCTKKPVPKPRKTKQTPVVSEIIILDDDDINVPKTNGKTTKNASMPANPPKAANPPKSAPKATVSRPICNNQYGPAQSAQAHSTPNEKIKLLKNSIYDVLKFESTNLAYIPPKEEALDKIYLARENLALWRASFNDIKLKLVRFHFEALEAILNVLIEEYNAAKSKRASDSMLYSLYATSVIDFCRCIEGYGKYTVNRKTPGNVQLSDWLDCNGDVVFYRNKLAHAEDKPKLEILRRLVVIALNWMKKYFFPNLSIDSRGSINNLVYSLDFPRVNNRKGRFFGNICAPITVPMLATSQAASPAVNGKRQPTVEVNGYGQEAKRTRVEGNARLPLQPRSGNVAPAPAQWDPHQAQFVPAFHLFPFSTTQPRSFQ